MKTGIDALREMRERQQAQTTNRADVPWKLWLKEGERAQLWFMTNGDEIKSPLIHLVPKKGAPGKKDWTKDVLCAKESYEDDTYCALCEDDSVYDDGPNVGKKIIRGPYTRLVLLTYVQDIFHPYANPKSDGPVWTEVPSKGGPSQYRESVNDYRLLIAKQKLEAQIEEAYWGDPTSEDYSTRTPSLLDRPFILVRTGSGSDVQETLRPQNPAEMPKAIVEARAKAPDLEKIVIAEFTDRVARAGAVRNATSKSTGGYDPDAAGSASEETPEEDALLDFE